MYADIRDLGTFCCTKIHRLSIFTQKNENTKNRLCYVDVRLKTIKLLKESQRQMNIYFFIYILAETDPHEGKRINESLWPVFKIHHQKSRYIYDLFYRRKAISRELYDYCIQERIADANLIAKWKKSGYENLCCLRCIQTRDTNFGTNCICRVPKAKLEEGRVVECVHCGCRGCSG